MQIRPDSLVRLNVSTGRSITAAGYYRKGPVIKNNIATYIYFYLYGAGAFMTLLFVLYSKASRRKFFPNYPEVRKELSWWEAIKFDEYQAMKWSTQSALSTERMVDACDKILVKDDISDLARSFFLQFKGMALFDAGEFRQSKQCFMQSLELCNKMNRKQTDLMVITNTLYMSLIVLSQEQDVDRGLKGLLFCATTAYSNWNSWKSLGYDQFLSNCSLALQCMSMYVRVAMNVRGIEPLDDENFRAFVSEAERMMDFINNKRYFGNAMILKADNILFTYSAMVANDMAHYLLENLKKDEDPEEVLGPYFVRFRSYATVLRKQGADQTERLYMDVNRAFVDELKGNYSTALERLKCVSEKAKDDDKIERLVQHRYKAVLEKRDREDQNRNESK